MRSRHKAHLMFEAGIETRLQFCLSGVVAEMHPRFDRFPYEHQRDVAWVGVVEPHLLGQEWDVMVEIAHAGAVIRLTKGPHLMVECAKCCDVVWVHLEDQDLYWQSFTVLVSVAHIVDASAV